MKLQTMSNEGDKKAKAKLKDINDMISDDEKYSKIENKIVQFYVDNCPLYFDRFKEDVEYLKNCRNKCAHLKVNGDSLFIPKDYQARMLICSMFDNVLSVKAPFIMDLFSFVESDIEKYNIQCPNAIYDGHPDDSVLKEIKSKYFVRMTYDSIKKSYKTFFRLLFISDDESAKQNVNGLYVFLYGLTEFSIRNGYSNLFKEESIVAAFARINKDCMSNNKLRRNALIGLMIFFPVVMDLIRADEELFDYLSNAVVNKPQGLKYYKDFFPRNSVSIYKHFMDTANLHCPFESRCLYDALKEQEDFSADEFFTILAKNIPAFNGFSSADAFMVCLLEHKEELSLTGIKEIRKIYMQNQQCTGRGRHSMDIAELDKYISDCENADSDDQVVDVGIEQN